jgi:rubrerythrin
MTNANQIVRDIIGHNNKLDNINWNKLTHCTDCGYKLKVEGRAKWCPNCENVY